MNKILNILTEPSVGSVENNQTKQKEINREPERRRIGDEGEGQLALFI